ncbi:glycosyltransferase [Candidatus Pelagibacter sp.]|uniref:glycosyltransferase n=1 Tax=Candidatus Pelagibacter sp. TaxID=2024849 RepID=UPI003F842C82
MSISRQNLSVVIVSFFSEEVIHNCVQSIPEDVNILVVDNSGNKGFKESIEKQYKNVKCLLSTNNLGMGSGNNLGLKHINTDYAFILNPDVVLEKNTIDLLIDAAKEIESFGIIAPAINSKENLNYKLFDSKKIRSDDDNPFKVKSVDGFAMLLNLKKLKEIDSFKDYNFFDENIFLFLENDDLCKRLIDNNQNIYVVPKSKVNHLGASGVNKKFSYQIELSRNWHWIWSKFYYNKKHRGYLIALFEGLPTFLSSVIKFLLYSVSKNNKKKEIYLHRALGYLNAVLGRKSYYRPNIEN